MISVTDGTHGRAGEFLVGQRVLLTLLSKNTEIRQIKLWWL